MREVPRIGNRSMRELQAAPVNFFAELNASTQRKKDLLAFTKGHPSSYVGLWEMVQLLGFGYDPLLDSTYLTFDAGLKKTATGARLSKLLVSTRMTAVGKPFPTVTLRTVSNQPVELSAPQLARYTLIDFWFSHCSACIDQFPKLKALFNTYPRTDFNVLQISTDGKAEVAFWKKTIQRYELPWPQYLDEGGAFTTGTLAIDGFPSNFLLDQQGHILRRDIRPDELEKFLATKLANSAK